MSSPFLVVDTNVISCIWRNDSRAAAYEAILSRAEHPVLSFQAVAELEFGMVRSAWGAQKRRAVQVMISDWQVMYPDETLCSIRAAIRAGREAVGRPIHASDAWIAALVFDMQCPVLTHNVKDFAGIDGATVLTASGDSGASGNP